MQTYGDSVVSEMDVPLEDVKRVLLRQMAETIVQLTLGPDPISRVQEIRFREGGCVMQPFCDHVTRNPHRVVGWTFEAE